MRTAAAPRSDSAGSTVAVAAFVAGATALVAAVFLVIDPLKYAAAAAVAEGIPLREAAVRALRGLSPAAYLAPILGGVLLLAALLAELRSGALSRAIEGSARWPRQALFAAALAWFAHSYLLPGFFVTGDSGAHVAEVARRAAAFWAGDSLHWNNLAFLGQPVPEYYAPVSYGLALAGALALGATAAFKLLLALWHVGSGYAAYWLMRTLGVGPVGAFFGGLVYAASFAHIHLTLQRGSIQLAVNFLLLPLALAFARRLAREPRLLGPDWLALAGVAAALVANHAPNGVYAGAFLALFSLAAALAAASPVRALVAQASAGIAALALAAFTLAPPLFSEGTAFEQAARPFYFALPDGDYFRSLLLWRNTRTSDGANWAAYLGTTALLLALAGLALRRRLSPEAQAGLWTAWALLVLSLVLRGSYVRDIILTTVFLAVAAGFGAEALVGLRRRWLAAGLLFAVVLFDLGPTAVQPVLRTDKRHLDEAGAWLAAQGGSRRVVLTDTREGRIRVHMGSSALPIHLHRVDFAAGWANGMAGVLNNYLLAMLGRIERELNAGQALSPQARELLCLLRVGRIVNEGRAAMGLPPEVAGAEEQGPLGRALPTPCGFEVVFAPRLVELVPPAELDRPPLWGADFADPLLAGRIAAVTAFVDRSVATMALNPATGAATAIPARRQLAAPPSSGAAAAVGGARVEDYTIAADRISLHLAAPQDGFVRLPHAWWPSLRAASNGAAIETTADSLGFVVLPVRAGENRLEVAPQPPAAQAWANRASAATLAAILLAALVAAALRRRGDGRAAIVS